MRLALGGCAFHAARCESVAFGGRDGGRAGRARRVAGEVCGLLASAPDAGAAVPGSDWNVGDVAAHLALGTEAYITYARGVTEPFVDVSGIAGGSLARTSAVDSTRSPNATFPC